MSSFPGADDIVSAYEDQLEALQRLFHGRAALAIDPTSRFHSLTDAEIQGRLELDRREVDLWALMMLVASFEAMIRTDFERRCQKKTKHDVTKDLRALVAQYQDRVRLDDILATWDARANVGATVKNNVRNLLSHRHWIAHGRHWTNKHGKVPSPLDAQMHVVDYLAALQAIGADDFPLG